MREERVYWHGEEGFLSVVRGPLLDDQRSVIRGRRSEISRLRQKASAPKEDRAQIADCGFRIVDFGIRRLAD